MFRKIIGDRYGCGLDLGAQSIKVSLVKGQEQANPALLGVYEAGTRGFKSSSVSDLGEMAESIHAAVDGLSKKTSIKIKEVHLGLSGAMIEKRFCSAIIPLVDHGTKVISLRDVKKVKSQARLLGVNMDDVVLHDFPQYYRVDEVNTAVNPIGLYGRKLEINTMLILVNGAVLRNIVKAVNQAGYDAVSLSFSSHAAAEASLNEFYKRQGCMFLDIGASATNIVIFKEGQLRYVNSIALGGADVTRSIVNKLTIPFDVAEDIKKSYASVASPDLREEEEILIKKDEGYTPVKKEAICEAFGPVVSQFTGFVNENLRTSRMADQLNAGIVVCGGGALLPGLAEHIETVTKLPVKMGNINIAVKRLHNAAKYAAAIGLAQRLVKEPAEEAASSPPSKNFVQHLANKAKEIYLEYF